MIKDIRKKILELRDNKFMHLLIYSKFIDYHQWALLNFVKKSAMEIKSKASILDAGAGEMKYKIYFKHCKYVSQDLGIGDKSWYFKDIDIKSTIYNIPVKNSSFENILCTQVLEHLEFPELAFKEFSRILKKKGTLILTVPLAQGEHQIPYDYFRYTKYSLKSLGKKYGFKLKVIEPHGGIFIALNYIIWQIISTFTPFRNILIIKFFQELLFLPLKFITGMAFYYLDKLDVSKNFTINYNCIFTKEFEEKK